MDDRYTHENRPVSLKTPLGENVLLISNFTAVENISSLFDFDLELFSEKHDIPFDKIIGEKVTIALETPGNKKRYFSGIVSRFSHGVGGAEVDPDHRFSFYRATVVPWLWLLKRTANCRIFHDKTAPDIIREVFKDDGLTDYSIRLEGSSRTREYCVQYRETDFNFVSRLMEEEGIHYYFEHDEQKHVMVLANSLGGHPALGKARCEVSAGGHHEDVITDIEKLQEIRAGAYTLSDFNFKTPTTSLEANRKSSQPLGPEDREVFDYPGCYLLKSEGDDLTKVRIQEEDTQITTISGSSSMRAFTAGYRFTLSGHNRQEMNDKDYVLTSVYHHARQSWGHDASFTYLNNFSCVPIDTPYRPRRVTPKPFIQGSQTAIVTDWEDPDGHGRVKVRFHWDRKKDESCWVRVSQPWAGNEYGFLFLPRVEHEVIVDFLEGDPDRPIITGSVYNGDNKTPYPLPSKKTKSVIRSENENELCFDDDKGNELVYLYAKKDRKTKVENDEKHEISGNHTIDVQGSMKITVGPSGLTIDCMGEVKVTGSAGITLTAPIIKLTAPMVQASGVVQCQTLIAATGVVSPSYTPGVGNIV